VPAAAARTPLSIYYQGLRFPVDKERFVIGRGKTASDLVIKDPNVSRQHALVEWHDGHWYVVDMGSTNGFEVHGTRVQRRQVSAGDVITVCNHELEFVFE
jgi:pSer/pThr/pTyr-binding forkhead associated (FHA) protein